MTSLIGIILLLMGLIHWLLEPLEAVLTAVLSLRWLGWVVLPTVLWVFSGRHWERPGPSTIGSRLTDLNRWPSLYKSAALPLS